MDRKRNPAFIVELLMLFILLLFVIVMITKTCVAARSKSLDARHLTEAVCLARDAAEVSLSAKDRTEAEERLREMDAVREMNVTAEGVELIMASGRGGSSDVYRLVLTWQEEPSGNGNYTTGGISVYYGNDADPVYTLETGSYRPEAGYGA